MKQLETYVQLLFEPASIEQQNPYQFQTKYTSNSDKGTAYRYNKETRSICRWVGEEEEEEGGEKQEE